MSFNEDEEEIKIEYHESFEVDPLCENREKNTCEYDRTDDFILPNFPNENINQDALNIETESLENVDSTVHDENEYPINNPVSEIEEKWYKQVDNTGRYICKFCDNCYSTIQTVRHHVKNKHVEEYNREKKFTNKNIRRCKLKCHVCKKRFKDTNGLQEHVRNHGINNIKKSCIICQATFQDDTEMLNHMTNKHKLVSKKKHFCSLCGYSTNKISHFKQHEKTHTGNDQKKCSFCEYSTNHPPNLKIHERIHTNDKPYSCSFNGCDYRSAAKAALYSHRLKHEKEKNIIYCDKCSYSTVYKQSLKKHIDSHRRNSVRTRF